jgi:hypothetical protein
MTLRAFHLMINWPLHINLDESLIDLQIDIGNKPWRNET